MSQNIRKLYTKIHVRQKAIGYLNPHIRIG